MNGPLPPEDLDAAQAYWNTPGIMSTPAAPPPVEAPASYYGPPAPEPGRDPVDFERLRDPVDVNWPPPPREPVDFQREQPPGPATREPESFDRLRDPVSFDRGPEAPAGRQMESFTREQPAAPSAGQPVAAGGAGGAGGSMSGLIGDKAKSYGRQTDAMRAEAGAQGEQATIMAEAQGKAAAQKQKDAADAAAEEALAQKKFDEHLEQSQRLADAIASQKIDTASAFKDRGAAAMAVIGGLLGGMYQGMNKLASNPFIDNLNRVIDREIAVQEAELKNRKDMLADRRNGLAQMIATFKDSRLAKAEYKKMLLEGTLEAAKAKAATYDSPIIQARVDQAVEPVNRAVTDLKLDELRREAAAAAAGQARKAAAEKERWERLKWAAEQEHAAKKLALEEKKVEAESGKRTHEDVKHIGDKLQTIEDKNPQSEDVKNLMARKGADGTIPGTGTLARARDVVAPPIGSGGALDLVGMLGPVPAAVRLGTRYFAGLNPEEQDTRNAIERLHQLARHEVTGAAFSAQEKADIQKGQLGQLTPAEETALVERMNARLEEQRNIIKGENPEAADILEANKRSRHKANKKLDLK